jgi:hypothetical protein
MTSSPSQLVPVEPTEAWSCGICNDSDVPEKFRVFGLCYICAAHRSIGRRDHKIRLLEAQIASLAISSQGVGPSENEISATLCDVFLAGGSFDQQARTLQSLYDKSLYDKYGRRK